MLLKCYSSVKHYFHACLEYSWFGFFVIVLESVIYSMISSLFRGISSIVRRCIEKETDEEFAVKIIDISGEKSDIYEADLTKKDTIREINILRMCKGHDNISKTSVLS